MYAYIYVHTNVYVQYDIIYVWRTRSIRVTVCSTKGMSIYLMALQSETVSCIMFKILE